MCLNTPISALVETSILYRWIHGWTKTDCFQYTPRNIRFAGFLSFNPLPDEKFLERSNLKQSADDTFKFDENSRKFSEKTLSKEAIARFEQFLLFPPCFQNACILGASKGVIVWEWVK